MYLFFAHFTQHTQYIMDHEKINYYILYISLTFSSYSGKICIKGVFLLITWKGMRENAGNQKKWGKS